MGKQLNTNFYLYKIMNT